MSDEPETYMEEENVYDKVRLIRSDLLTVIRGKEEAADFLLTAILAGGNVLLEDVPGVGKTTMAKALASALSADFKRVQFTPDLLPSDILGASIFHANEEAFNFYPGPVFTNVFLADEINRASPRTQSALLEAMNEKQVTIEGILYELPSPFFVIATENPIEYYGTYPLPEAQLDRFAIRMTLGYPDEASELAMLEDRKETDPLLQIVPRISCEELLLIQQDVKTVEIEESLVHYMHQIILATRADERIRLGASPRAFLTYAACVRAFAWLNGRRYVIPEDVRRLAGPVLCHRIVLNPRVSIPVQELISEILASIRIPD